MDLKLSDRVSQITESKTQKISTRAAELRAAGENIIGFAVGEPDFDTPDNVKDAAVRAIKEGRTKYTAVDGIPELKQAVVDKFVRENRLEYAANEIIVSSGAKQAIYNSCQALLNPGDEAVVPVPYWVSYPDIITLAGGKPVYVHTTEENGFKITPAQLKSAITPKTRLLFINSPNNPSGAVYSHDELAALGEVLVEHPNIAVISDDIYEHLTFGDASFCNILNARPDLKDRVVLINGVSKAYAMTGWRIGYAAAPAGIITAIKKIQSQSTSNASSIAQYASVEALNNSGDFVANLHSCFAERGQAMLEQLTAIPNISCRPCAGSFYLFPSVSAFFNDEYKTDIDLARYLLEEARIAVVPGSAFGMPGQLRFSFSCGLDTISEGVDRVRDALGKIS